MKKIIAIAAILPFLLIGCQEEAVKRFKLTQDVLESVECVPWPDTEEFCLCFGYVELKGMFSFLGPDTLCEDPDFLEDIE